MFVKPVKIKSNVQLKSSDRKKLQSRVQSRFNLSDLQLGTIFSTKSTISQLKVITHSDQIITVYLIDKRPMFFEISDVQLIPTVYSLWLVPEMVPSFTTHPNVLPRLANGADLMLPGVIKQGQGLQTYGRYRRDEVVAVNLTSNKAAVGVGTLVRSSEDLYMSGGMGVCVKMLHVFGDKLWGIDSSACLQMPNLGACVELPKDEDFPALGVEKAKKEHVPSHNTPWKQSLQTHDKKVLLDEFPALGISSKKTEVAKAVKEDNNKIAEISSPEIEECEEQIENLNDDQTEEDEGEAEILPEGPTEDEVLKTAFFTCLKRDGKSLTLPLLTSSFYRCHVLPAAERPIELKKTSYKKLSKFLDEMALNRLITVKEENKGIEKIIAVNLMHPDLLEFIPRAQTAKENAEKSSANNLFVSEMTELYLVTDETAQFFAHFNVTNGAGVESNQIKKLLKEYVCNNKLQTPLNPRIVQLNELLGKICSGNGDDNTISFDQLLATLLDKMTHSYEMRSKNELRLAKRATIQMTLATRSGNKKVTLVNNLEAFGIRLSEFEKACRLGVAASTTITKLPNQRNEQFLVQGNQIRFIYKLLTDTYKIPSKCIIGLEFARKEKKSKK